MRKLIAIGLLISSSHVLAVQQAVVDFVTSTKQSTVSDIEEIPEPELYKPVEYLGTNLRSPFKANQYSQQIVSIPIEIKPGVIQQPRPDANRTREYLERYGLKDFVMVGTLSKKGIVWGLVQDRSGIVHAVKTGDYIGENSGQAFC